MVVADVVSVDWDVVVGVGWVGVLGVDGVEGVLGVEGIVEEGVCEVVLGWSVGRAGSPVSVVLGLVPRGWVAGSSGSG